MMMNDGENEDRDDDDDVDYDDADDVDGDDDWIWYYTKDWCDDTFCEKKGFEHNYIRSSLICPGQQLYEQGNCFNLQQVIEILDRRQFGDSCWDKFYWQRWIKPTLMDKQLLPLYSVGWNYLSIPKLQRCNRQGLGMEWKIYFILHCIGCMVTYPCWD